MLIITPRTIMQKNNIPSCLKSCNSARSGNFLVNKYKVNVNKKQARMLLRNPIKNPLIINGLRIKFCVAPTSCMLLIRKRSHYWRSIVIAGTFNGLCKYCAY